MHLIPNRGAPQTKLARLKFDSEFELDSRYIRPFDESNFPR